VVQSLVARAQPHELAAILGAPAPHVPVGMLHKTMGGTCTYLLAAAEQKWRDEEEAAAAAPAAAPAAEKAARREREVVEAREVAKRLGEHAAAQAKKAQAVLLGCRSALRRLRRVLLLRVQPVQQVAHAPVREGGAAADLRRRTCAAADPAAACPGGRTVPPPSTRSELLFASSAFTSSLSNLE
jgi:hypothetical protein